MKARAEVLPPPRCPLQEKKMPVIRTKPIDDNMSEADLTAAANRIRQNIDWSRIPNLAEMFEHRPSVNVYWHELAGLLLQYLEKK